MPWEQPSEIRYALDNNGERVDVTLNTTPGVMFNGQTATRFDGTFKTSGGELQNTFYERLDGDIILRFGFRNLSQGGAVPGTNQTFSPPLQDLRFSLNAGESKTAQTQSTVETDGLPTTTINYEVTYNYVGQESVTVPAGTFNTCHIRTVTPSAFPGGPSSVRDEWFAVGSGMIVQSQEPGSGTDKLIEASINGQVIAGN